MQPSERVVTGGLHALRSMDQARDIAKIQKQLGGKEARYGPLVKGVGHEGAIGLTMIGLSGEKEHKLPFLLGWLLSIVFFLGVFSH